MLSIILYKRENHYLQNQIWTHISFSLRSFCFLFQIKLFTLLFMTSYYTNFYHSNLNILLYLFLYWTAEFLYYAVWKCWIQICPMAVMVIMQQYMLYPSYLSYQILLMIPHPLLLSYFLLYWLPNFTVKWQTFLYPILGIHLLSIVYKHFPLSRSHQYCR